MNPVELRRQNLDISVIILRACLDLNGSINKYAFDTDQIMQTVPCA